MFCPQFFIEITEENIRLVLREVTNVSRTLSLEYHLSLSGGLRIKKVISHH